MQDNYLSATGENQPLGPAGCRFSPIPGTRIALVIPSPEAEIRLGIQLRLPDRFKAIRGAALRNLKPGAEAFAQRNFRLGNDLYLTISLLTDHTHWRGGWSVFHCPPGEETAFVRYLTAARDAVVVSLRKERLQGGSKS